MTNREIGQRIKKVAKKNGFNGRAVADLLHYESEKTISKIYSGNYNLKDEHFHALAKAFHVREEYLKGLDDWETEQEMYTAIHQHNKDEYSAIIGYLKTLGLTLSPQICFVGNKYEFFQSYFFLSPCIADNEMKRFCKDYELSLPDNATSGIYQDKCCTEPLTLRQLYNLATGVSDYKDHYYDYDGEEIKTKFCIEDIDDCLQEENPYDDEDMTEICVPLISNPKDGIEEIVKYYTCTEGESEICSTLKKPSEITKEDILEDVDNEPSDGLPTEWQPYIDDNLMYGVLEIRYHVEFMGKKTDLLDVAHVSAFYRQVDALAKTSIETFLFRD